MTLPKRIRLLIVPAVTALLSSCAILGSSGSNVHVVDRAGLDIIAAPAGHLTIMVKDQASLEKACAGRMPDAVMDESISFALAGRATPGPSVGTGSSDLALGGRSPAVLIVRELYFRMCELALNQNLPPETALALFRETFPLLKHALESKVAGSAALSSTSVPALPSDANSSAPGATNPAPQPWTPPGTPPPPPGGPSGASPSGQ